MQQQYLIKELGPTYNKQIESVIRQCLIEFGANHEGTAWTDPKLGELSSLYNATGSKYWIAINHRDEVIAGVGIAPLVHTPTICELQKMYCRPDFRGSGVAHQLIQKAIHYAKPYYQAMYLETLDTMVAAQKFYEKYDFVRIQQPLANTGHFACDVCYIKTLNNGIV